jgi:putative endonuclease
VAYYVYIIKSEKDGSYYKGFSEDPIKRLAQHNNLESFYTSSKSPWKLVYVEIFSTKREAFIREKSLKKYAHNQIEILIKSSKNILYLLS